MLGSGRVRAAALVFFDFLSQPVRLWSGAGDLRTLGSTFKGTAGLGKLSVAGWGPAGIVETMTFSIAANATVLAAADQDAANNETDGRNVWVWLQFFDDRPGKDWALLGDPIFYFWGTMGPITVVQAPPDQAGAIAYSMSVTATNAMRVHSRPTLAFFADHDQKARSPDGLDNSCARMGEFIDGNVLWPRY